MANRSNKSGPERSAGERLRTAMTQLAANRKAGVPSAVALCELAGVSRTSLYRYHTPILNQLHALRDQRRRTPSIDASMLEKLREENRELRRQQAQVASMVDHYFAAWQEASSLLQRRDQELAVLRKSQATKPVALKR